MFFFSEWLRPCAPPPHYWLMQLHMDNQIHTAQINISSLICFLFFLYTVCIIYIAHTCRHTHTRPHAHTHTGRRVLICLALPFCRLSQIQSDTPLHCRHGALVVQAVIELNIPKFPQAFDHFPPFSVKSSLITGVVCFL